MTGRMCSKTAGRVHVGDWQIGRLGVELHEKKKVSRPSNFSARAWDHIWDHIAHIHAHHRWARAPQALQVLLPIASQASETTASVAPASHPACSGWAALFVCLLRACEWRTTRPRPLLQSRTSSSPALAPMSPPLTCDLHRLQPVTDPPPTP